MTAREPQTGSDDGGRYASFSAFYPYYIHEHSNRTCRRIHVVGTGLVIAAFGAFCVTRNAWWLLAMPLVGYGFAWVGHFFFEKNRPATFKYPLWSLMGDFRLFFETATGRRKF
ncbi:Mpo1-like protein [Brevundimonas sp.]|uniref:Mpo1-like protein n=1 Tax=Brevundimonas sp. TaxID=1871086 RepID=UPI0028968DC5|nr:Mpo1-like protein [Brevundimonas sp.]